MIVVWRMLNKCNLMCPFCAYDKRLDITRTAIDPQRAAEFLEALADYRNISGDDVLVSWIGGEPFIWKPLNSLTRKAWDLGLRLGATTNGTRLGSEAVRQHICRYYSELTISLDGFAAFHEPMRGWPGGFENLSRWVPALAGEARAAGTAPQRGNTPPQFSGGLNVSAGNEFDSPLTPLKLRINTVLMRQNIDDFPKLCLTLAGWGINEITFNQLGGRDRPEFFPEHRLRPADIDKLENMLPELRAGLEAKGVTLVGGSNYLKRLRASALGEPNPVADCHPGERFLFIDETGRAAPCNFAINDYHVDIDGLKTGAQIKALPENFLRMKKRCRAEVCGDCLSTQVFDKFALEK
ncbi:radical SAM protein [Deltaproteobacteria bacterium OttesenSCG-928-K17]|nr:radical SAM protein [Deltaproteobacteria bacterium OttesenSCG-928-K17]